MMVTIAICTRNRCDLLRQTLESVAQSAIPDGVSFEVLVVNNNSPDATPAVVEEFRDRLPVRMVVEFTLGASAARNRCLDEAEGEWVLFTDDDVQVGDRWVSTFVAAVAEYPDAAVVGGAIEPWFVEPPDPVLADVFPELQRGFCGLDNGVPTGLLLPNLPVWGANFAVRRDWGRRLRFDPALGPPHSSGEETDLVRRIRREGGRVLWVSGMPVRHYVEPRRTTLAYLRGYRATAGAAFVRLDGLPAAPSFRGAPRWLWRKTVESYAAYLAWRAMGSRRRALTYLREHDFYRGMLAEARGRAQGRDSR
jgi:glycosyltransferase involved in cell wall biosynthesis